MHLVYWIISLKIYKLINNRMQITLIILLYYPNMINLLINLIYNQSINHYTLNIFNYQINFIIMHVNHT